MSSIYRKIEYNTQDPFSGEIEKHTLYIHVHNTVDVTTIYDEKGEIILSYTDTVSCNILDKMVELVNELQTSPNIKPLSEADFKLLNI